MYVICIFREKQNFKLKLDHLKHRIENIIGRMYDLQNKLRKWHVIISVKWIKLDRELTIIGNLLKPN